MDSYSLRKSDSASDLSQKHPQNGSKAKESRQSTNIICLATGIHGRVTCLWHLRRPTFTQLTLKLRNSNYLLLFN